MSTKNKDACLKAAAYFAKSRTAAQSSVTWLFAHS